MPLQIAQLGQPVLRTPAMSVPLAEIAAPPFQEFLERMFETLVESQGVGLAAPQVFVSQRVFLAAILAPENDNDPPDVEAFINPVLTPLSDEKTNAWEGCLSFPELLVLVPRFRAVRIDYVDLDGEPAALELEDFPARVVQHEFDHLEGILTLDRAVSSRHIVKASEIDAARKALGLSDSED